MKIDWASAQMRRLFESRVTFVCVVSFCVCVHASKLHNYRRLSRASEGHVVQQRAVVANGRRFANHDPGSVVHEHALWWWKTQEVYE